MKYSQIIFIYQIWFTVKSKLSKFKQIRKRNIKVIRGVMTEVVDCGLEVIEFEFQ